MAPYFHTFAPIRWLNRWKTPGMVMLTIIALFVFLSSSFEPWPKLPRMTTPLTYPLQVGQRLWLASIGALNQWWQSYIQLQDVAQENLKLRQELNQLHEQLLIHHHHRAELASLKELLQFKQQSPQPIIAAQVVHAGGSNFQELITINKGTAVGIRVGMPALSPDGLVGWVSRVQRWHSFIQPLTSLRSRVDVLVQRTRLRGTLKGSGLGTLLWQPKLGEDIMMGDLLISSGLVGALPKGYPVATIAAITYDLDMAAKLVELHPTQNPLNLEHLLIMATTDPILDALQLTPPHEPCPPPPSPSEYSC